MYQSLAVVGLELLHPLPRDKSHGAADQLIQHRQAKLRLLVEKEVHEPARSRLVLLDELEKPRAVHARLGVRVDEKYMPELMSDRRYFVDAAPNLRLFK